MQTGNTFRTLQRIGLALALALSGGVASAYTDLVVFGDSLSDNGRTFALTGGAYPPSPYATQFSNGPVAVQYMASALGLRLTDYAVGGAMTNTQNSVALTTPALAPALGTTGIYSQINSWAPSSTPTSSSLYMVWGGANDVLYNVQLAMTGQPIDFNRVISNSISSFTQDITLLASKGAHDIFVPNMADLSLTPRSISNGAGVTNFLRTVTNVYNMQLATQLSNLEKNLGVDIIAFDTASFMRNLAADPAAAGFSNITTSCISGGATAIISGCAGYEYFDDIHPTTAAHSLLGAAFASTVPVPEPATYAMMLAGLAGIACLRRRRAA